MIASSLLRLSEKQPLIDTTLQVSPHLRGSFIIISNHGDYSRQGMLAGRNYSGNVLMTPPQIKDIEAEVSSHSYAAMNQPNDEVRWPRPKRIKLHLSI